MKGDHSIVVISATGRPTPAASPADFCSPSPAQAQRPWPTPSPFSFTVGSTTSWTSGPYVQYFNLVLRFMALIFSFISAFSLAVPAPAHKRNQEFSSFNTYPELLYEFVVTILVFFYSAFQLSKCVCDFANRGILISDKVSDYSSFIIDQMVGYLLISSSSVAIPTIYQIDKTAPLYKAGILSVSMALATTIIIVICTLLSGYKLCKRIIW